MTNLGPQTRILPAIAALLLIPFLLDLAGCRVGPPYQMPPATAQAPPAAYKETPVNTGDASIWAPAQPQDAMLRGKWWEIYNDPELNTLEDQLNINNQNIKLYFENFMEARTLITQARSQLYPTIGTAPAFSRSKGSGNLGSGTVASGSTATGGGSSTVESLPLEISWEPDLWGKVRNTIRQYQFAAQLSAADLENERLTEQASLATYFFELRGQDALQALYNQTVDADQKAVELTQSLYDAGITDQISVVEAHTTLESAQASATNLGVARAQYEHAIAVLVGTSASGFSMPVKQLNATPPPIPIGVPTQLLQRRPDIAAAERNMASANAQIGIAYAAYYPSLTLSAGGGFESSSLGHLLDWSSRFWSVGGSVDETIFDAGLRRATVNQYIATYNADVASYRQTVLSAFQQVEDNLAATAILSRQIQQQQVAVQSAQKFLDLETGRYQAGVDPYVDVVTAQTTLLSNQQTLTSLHTQAMTYSVQLIEALGGGWDSTQLPTPGQISPKLTRAEAAIQK